MRNFLTLNWGNSDKPYCLRTFKNKDEVRNFYENKFSKFDKSGIAVMRIKGFDDAGGHTTLWNGENKKFEDSKISENYLIGNHNVVDFQFWELK
nr:T6SS effector amidase Tae4 family protein [uncultured Helicobacter sp.]